MNERYGFLAQLEQVYGLNYLISLSFLERIYAHLHVYQLIYTPKGSVLAVHGGVSLV